MENIVIDIKGKKAVIILEVLGENDIECISKENLKNYMGDSYDIARRVHKYTDDTVNKYYSNDIENNIQELSIELDILLNIKVGIIVKEEHRIDESIEYIKWVLKDIKSYIDKIYKEYRIRG